MLAAALLVVWLLLPALVLGAWMFVWARPGNPGDAAVQASQHRARMSLAGVIGLLAAASVAFRLMTGTGLEQTAALFIGIPALLACAALFIPTATAVGVACKAVTVGMLISLVFLGEGVVCVAMSAPLFYLVAVIVGGAVETMRRSRGEAATHRTFSLLALLAIGPMSLEGVTPITTIDRDVTVSETRVVHASADAVAAAIRQQPRFGRRLPAYLGIGFPRPTFTWIDERHWVIRMRGGEMRLDGMEPQAGNLHLAIDEQGPGRIRWRAVSDNSHMTHFLNWQASQVEWQAIDAETTRVTWTLSYKRGLDPAWYFGPMERYAVGLAAGYLIDAVATP